MSETSTEATPRKRNTRTITQRVVSATRKDRPATVASISKASGVPVGQARLVLEVLAETGSHGITRIGVKQTGKRGRPAFLFQKEA